MISFLSDFGLEDEWVAVCKGVIKRISPEAEIIDITHQIPPYGIRKGALVLASTLAYMPVGVHLAVVDPGVGGGRKPIAIRAKRGDSLVGPDNGLFSLAVERVGGVQEAVEITNHKFMLEPVSLTFQARDIFAPAAAYLSQGIELKEFGQALNLNELNKISLGKTKVLRSTLEAEVIDIDSFGTVRLNCYSDDLKKVGVLYGDEVVVKTNQGETVVPFLKTFSERPRSKSLLLVDSSGFVCLAVSQGSAAEELGLKIGDGIVIRLRSS